MRKLFSIVRTTQERLLLYIFVTIGLRIAAVAALKILDVTKARLQTTEKGVFAKSDYVVRLWWAFIIEIR